jgi:hypothetical protein
MIIADLPQTLSFHMSVTGISEMNKVEIPSAVGWIVAAIIGAILIASPLAAEDNLIVNGSFELDVDRDGVPDHWASDEDCPLRSPRESGL